MAEMQSLVRTYTISVLIFTSFHIKFSHAILLYFTCFAGGHREDGGCLERVAQLLD